MFQIQVAVFPGNRYNQLQVDGGIFTLVSHIFNVCLVLAVVCFLSLKFCVVIVHFNIQFFVLVGLAIDRAGTKTLGITSRNSTKRNL